MLKKVYYLFRIINYVNEHKFNLICRKFSEMEAKKICVVQNEVTMWNLLLENFNVDVLVEIIKHVGIFETTLVVCRFVKAWKIASNNQWQTLDFSMLKSDFVKTSNKPFVWVHSRSENTLYNLLFVAMELSQGNIKNLIFHYNLYLTNDQFVYTAIRYVTIYNFSS